MLTKSDLSAIEEILVRKFAPLEKKVVNLEKGQSGLKRILTRIERWARQDSNLGPPNYQFGALTD